MKAILWFHLSFDVLGRPRRTSSPTPMASLWTANTSTSPNLSLTPSQAIMRTAQGLASLGIALGLKGAQGLHESEAGKLDWHRQNLGRIQSARFDGRGRVTVVGEAPAIASLNSASGELAWRRVLDREDAVDWISTARGHHVLSVSSSGRLVRLWSILDGSMLWECSLGSGLGDEEEGVRGAGAGAIAESAAGEEVVVVVNEGGIHVVSAVSGSILTTWSSDPTKEEDLAAIVGRDAKVAFTSLRRLPGGRGLVAGGWAGRGGTDTRMAVAEWLVMAEVDAVKRSVSFKATKVNSRSFNPEQGVTLAGTRGGGYAVAALAGGGGALVVFDPLGGASAAVELAVPKNLMGSAPIAIEGVREVSGTNGAALELLSTQEHTPGATATAGVVFLSGEGASLSMVGLGGKFTCLQGDAECAIGGGVGLGGRTFVGQIGGGGGGGGDSNSSSRLTLAVAELKEGGVVVEEGLGLPVSALERGAVMDLFLEVMGDGGPGLFRALVSFRDHSVAMLAGKGLLWEREEALSAVEQVDFVDAAKDELSLLAESNKGKGRNMDHHIPGWLDRLELHRLELTAYLSSFLERFTGLTLPGGHVLEEVDSAHTFGLKKLALCTTTVGKLFAINMADGSIKWSALLPSFSSTADPRPKVILHATRTKSALGYNPEFVLITIEESRTLFAWYDALSGVETMSRELPFKAASIIPMEAKAIEVEGRCLLMVVDSEGGVSVMPDSEEAVAGMAALVPHLFHHHLTETGLESFAVRAEPGGELSSIPAAAVALLPKERLVASAYPDRREVVQTPAHTLGDDSLLIKYINPRLLAIATLTEGGGLVGSNLTVLVVDHVSGRVLHRILHKGAAEPVHMVVSESWVVYTYWSAKAHRTEMSSLSFYDGMIDKYGLSPFNRPEWKETFSSFESRSPIVLQKTFIFPYPVTGLSNTLTKYGITSKHILVTTALGQVVSLDRHFIDPRRPMTEPTKAEKEEKLLEYMPFLPVYPVYVVSYHKVIERVDRAITVPTALESTSLLLALGLDLFGSRVTPSKTYDLLDPHFNYALLALVLGAMAVAVVVAGQMLSSKRLGDQWV